MNDVIVIPERVYPGTENPEITIPDVGGPPMPEPPSSGGNGMFDLVFTLFPLLIIAFLVFAAFVGYRNYRAAKRGGVDPFAVDTELKVRAIRSDFLRADRDLRTDRDPQSAGTASIETRLAELDDLHQRGVISADERTTARAEILAGD